MFQRSVSSTIDISEYATMADLRFRFRVQGADQQPWSHDLDTTRPTFVGRAAHCDLVLEDESRLVSKEHAKLERRAGEWILIDLGSKNRTRINDVPLEVDRDYTISPGDRITIGSFELVLEVIVPADDGSEDEGGESDDDPTVVEDDELADVDEPMSTAAKPVSLEEIFEARELSDERVRELLEALGRATARLISIPDRFRHEFVGITIPGESLYHLANDPDRLLIRLMDPASSNEQFESLVAQIEEAVRRVINHQLAMLEGYSSCVKEHVSLMTERLDPDRLRAKAEAKGGIAAKLPILADREAMRVLEEEHRQQSSEDWSAIEMGVFRKVFRDAYLSRTS